MDQHSSDLGSFRASMCVGFAKKSLILVKTATVSSQSRTRGAATSGRSPTRAVNTFSMLLHVVKVEFVSEWPIAE